MQSPKVHDGMSKFVVAVLGVTGVGKSRFVYETTGDRNVHVSSSLESATQDFQAATFHHNSQEITLIDTPGFDDTYRSDTEIFVKLAEWLASTYHDGFKLSGILYLQRITDVRLGGSQRRNLVVMKKMLGTGAFSNLILVSTHWDEVSWDTGIAREAQLIEGFWKDMIALGARSARFDGKKVSGLRILEILKHTSPVTLSIQRELVDEGISLDGTSSGIVLTQELLKNASIAEHEIQSLGEEAGRHPEESEEIDREKLLRIRHLEDSISQRAALKAHWNAGSNAMELFGISPESSSYKSDMYSKIDLHDFRLVELKAGEGDVPIEISIMVTKIDDAPIYFALSYSVGTGKALDSIKLRRDRWVTPIPVTGNLKEALKYLRRKDRDILIWVDALSINQNDLDERAREVKRMSQIFRTADNVCIWLGTSDDESKRAMKFIPEILDFDSIEASVVNAEKKHDWIALAKLMSRAWFRRRWVVQEIVLAKSATVHCGADVVSWSQLRDAVMLFPRRWDQVRGLITATESFELGHAQLLGATNLIEVSDQIFRQDENGNILERLLSMVDLVALLPMFEVTVLLDAVYAVMDLAKDTSSADELTVDYGLQPERLFTDVVKLAVRNSHSLDIICTPWAPICGLPSWIPTVAKYKYKRRENSIQYDRQHGDSFVGSSRNKTYRACGGSTCLGNATFSEFGDDFVLRAWGFGICEIGDIGDQCRNGNVPAEWAILGEWPNKTRPIPTMFWRTLVANRASNGSIAPTWYGRACEYAFRKSTSEDIETSELLKVTSSSEVQELLNRVRNIAWKRRLAVLQVKLAEHASKRLGLCPAEAERGDKICILFGCSVPVVLRPQKNCFRLIGECFVYGMMDGEAINDFEAGRFQRQAFDIY